MRQKTKDFLNKINFNAHKGIVLTMVLLLVVAGVSHAQFYRITGGVGFGYGYGYGYEDGYGYGYGYHADDEEDNEFGYLYSNRLPSSEVTDISRTGAIVKVTTKYNSLASLDYGTTSGTYTSGMAPLNTPSAWVKERSFVLDDLTCGTTYYYQATVKDIDDNEWSETEKNFKTSACATSGGSSTPPADDEDDEDEEDVDEEDVDEEDVGEEEPEVVDERTPEEIKSEIKEKTLLGVNNILEAIKKGLLNGTISIKEASSVIEAITDLLRSLFVETETPAEVPEACDGITFTRNLTVGSIGDDVKCLQATLNARGFQLASTGAGSPGNETIYFVERTRAALARFQAANDIFPAVGYFGPITRAFLSQ